MRVIAGEFRSRVLKSVPGLETRPTPDRLREALFSSLGNRIDGCSFADLYAGTGAVGIEALSRGAKRAWFLESNRKAADVIRENLKSLGIENRADVRQGKVVAMISLVQADIVFIDPPYEKSAEYEASLDAVAKLAPGLVLVQHDTHQKLKDAYGALQRTRTMKHGSNCITFFASGPRGDR